MRAIFIDAVGRKVEEVQIENDLEAFYSKIGYEIIEVLLPISGLFSTNRSAYNKSSNLPAADYSCCSSELD